MDSLFTNLADSNGFRWYAALQHCRHFRIHLTRCDKLASLPASFNPSFPPFNCGYQGDGWQVSPHDCVSKEQKCGKKALLFSVFVFVFLDGNHVPVVLPSHTAAEIK